MLDWLRKFWQRFFGPGSGSSPPPPAPSGTADGKIGVRIILCATRVSGRQDYVTVTINADPSIDPDQLVAYAIDRVLAGELTANAWSMSDPIEKAEECGFYLFEHGFDSPSMTL